MFANCTNLKILDISRFSGEARTKGILYGVPMSGQIKVNRRYAETIKKYVPKKWAVYRRSIKNYYIFI